MDTKLAKPQGLLKRGNSYFFQARIPTKYSEHFPKSLIQEKLPTDSYAEAVMLVRQKWVDLDKKFTLINSATTQLASTITLEAMQSIVDMMVCDKLASDAGMRSKGYYRDPSYKHQALARLTRDEDSVRESISEGNYESLLSSAASLLKGNGYALDTNAPEFKCFIELFTEGLDKVNRAVRERNLGNVTEEPVRPVSFVRNSLSNSEETYWDSLDKLKDYWLKQPAKW